MRTVDLFLIEGSYRTAENGVVVELFGKTRDGTALVARYYGFRPYFVLLEPAAEVLDRLRADPEVVEIQPTPVWLGGRERPGARITIRSPWKVPEYRDRLRLPGDEPNVLACDIPFVHRFLYDKHVGLTLTLDVEDEPDSIRALYTSAAVVRVVSEGGKDIRPAEAFRPPLRTLSFDIENAIRERTIFTICGVAEGGGRERRTFRFGDRDERRILERFVEFVLEDDPDVITGYNIAGYDIPLLQERAMVHGLELRIGRDRTTPRDMGERLWRVTGRVIADAWWWAHRELRPKQETLQFVARMLLADSKLDVDRRNISAEWEKDPDRVMEYCEHDADLALRILQRLRSIDRGADLGDRRASPSRRGPQRPHVAVHRRS
ncbi:DNA polymerase II [mine drainage metagenome]|uniref:DNA polymerase II n=1 Tax=mine drainage metagenome TaxID=410659 RepID=T1BZL2_9ZZZZ